MCVQGTKQQAREAAMSQNEKLRIIITQSRNRLGEETQGGKQRRRWRDVFTNTLLPGEITENHQNNC